MSTDPTAAIVAAHIAEAERAADAAARMVSVVATDQPFNPAATVAYQVVLEYAKVRMALALLREGTEIPAYLLAPTAIDAPTVMPAPAAPRNGAGILLPGQG